MSPSLAHLIFSEFWDSLPAGWQKGICEAIAGNAFRGNLDTLDGKPSVAVFFVPADIADKVEAFIEGKLNEQ